MRTIAIAMIALTLWGCSNKKNEQVTDSTTRVENFTDAQAVTKIASDKELLRQTLIEAGQRGTLAEGIAAAALDSTTAAKMRAALMGPAVITPAGSARKSSGSSHPQTAAEKKDALDKANESLDKANKTVQKSGEVINKAQDVGKRAGDILNGRR